MLFSIIHDEFSLKTAHLVPNEDIRHRNYLKMLPKQKRTDLENELEEDSNLSISIFKDKFFINLF